jgi:Mg2+ and Co2+ transporter CorA
MASAFAELPGLRAEGRGPGRRPGSRHRDRRGINSDARVAGRPVMALELGFERRTPRALDPAHPHLPLTDCRAGEDGIELQRTDLVLGERFLLSAHRGPAPLAKELRRHIPDDFARSPGFLLYEVGARLLDSCRGVQARLEERLASLQERVVASDADAVAEIPELDRELLAFRRAVIATRGALSELGGRRSRLVSEATRPFLSAQALALDRLRQDTPASREILANGLGLHIATSSSRAGRVLGRLTGITVVFLPLLFAVQVAKAGLDRTSPWSSLWVLGGLYAGGVVWYMRRHRLL